MMTANAIKKLAKFGEVHQNANSYWAISNGQKVSFIDNGGRITCEHVQSVNDPDNLSEDYFGGVFCSSLSQAIRIAGH
jgi:hypothetical protein